MILDLNMDALYISQYLYPNFETTHLPISNSILPSQSSADMVYFFIENIEIVGPTGNWRFCFLIVDKSGNESNEFCLNAVIENSYQSPPETCTDFDDDSYFKEIGCGTMHDCNDNDESIFPGATEICDDSIDNDCDNKTDCDDDNCSGDPQCLVCKDNDNDAYYSEKGCGTEQDCNDKDELIYPGATETCSDEKDNDCDSLVDCEDPDCEFDMSCRTCTDSDGDNFYLEGSCGTEQDCNDIDELIYPGATEICDDGKDNDCDGKIDCVDTDCESDLTCCALDTKFEQTTLINGVKCYTDRGYELTNIPEPFISKTLIKTPDEDQNLTNESDYLTFVIPSYGTVYLAFDWRVIELPDWANGFTATGDTLGSSESWHDGMKVYSKTYEAGECVNFGANKGPGFSGEKNSYSGFEYATNYVVFY